MYAILVGGKPGALQACSPYTTPCLALVVTKHHRNSHPKGRNIDSALRWRNAQAAPSRRGLAARPSDAGNRLLSTCSNTQNQTHTRTHRNSKKHAAERTQAWRADQTAWACQRYHQAAADQRTCHTQRNKTDWNTEQSPPGAPAAESVARAPKTACQLETRARRGSSPAMGSAAASARHGGALAAARGAGQGMPRAQARTAGR